ncbi:MAG: sugar phosphate isomerase/epimerase [Actinomycetota bacterium]|nr:sugar phosphate isomerase/epimerase [Actinomycetota bacterium]
MTPRFSISQVTTLPQAFDDDLRTYAAAGADGIGIWEVKLPDRDDAETMERVRESGLAVTNCVPALPSILPMPGFEEPRDPAERVRRIGMSIRRFALFEPAAVVCLTGARGPREALLEGLRTVAAEGERADVPVGLEPMQPLLHRDSTQATTIEQALALLDAAGTDRIGIIFDTWQLWNDEDVLEDIGETAERIVAVHVGDWREPTRSWADRALPGEGSIDLASILRALHDAGWPGYYDLEIFSDDGSFGHDFDDSLWKADPLDVARRGREGFLAAWDEAMRRG